MKVLALDADDVLSLCTMKQCIEEVRKAFLSFGDGRVEMPLRTRIGVTERRSILFMPSLVRNRTSDASLKVVSVYPDLGPGRASISATVLLVDGRDGEVKAIMDGRAITSIRTGAASGLSCRYLARRDSSVLGLIGAGGQAFHQASAVCCELPMSEVRVFSRHKEKSAALAARLRRELKVDAVAASSSRGCVEGCDVVVTATTSRSPVFDGRLVEDGTHVIAIGSFTPESREVDSSLMARASIYVDSLEACMAEAGDILIPMREGVIGRSAVRAELSDLISGKKKGRRSADEVTLFKSVGLAIEDTAAGWLAYRRAADAGRGVSVDL